MKKLILILMFFSVMLLTFTVNVDAVQSGYDYYIEPPFEVPPTNDFHIEVWKDGSSYGVEGYWNFAVSFEIEEGACLEDVKVDVIDALSIEIYLDQTEGGTDIYDDWYIISASDYFDDMLIDVKMVLYYDIYYQPGYVVRMISPGRVYEMLASDYTVFEDVYTLYPVEKLLYKIEFEFEIDFDIDLTDLYDGIIYDDITEPPILQYQVGLYYNTSVYREAYWEGYFEGIIEGRASSNAEAYEEGRSDGYILGYNAGYADAQESEESGFLSFLSSLWVAISSFLSITLFWDISIGAIVLIPIVFGLISFIVGKGKD